MASRPPENFARKLWSRLHLQEPVNLETVATAIGLTIRKVNSTAYEGTMRRLRGRALGVVGVRAAIKNPGRERFTIAHEIGHYVLGRNDFLGSACTWRDIGMTIREKPEREIAANRFAAELLLPSDRVRTLIQQQPLSIETVQSVSQRFRVSLTAAAIQCAAVTEQTCAVVVSINGIIRFYKPSKSWTYFITTDRPFGKGSVAARLDLVDNEATAVVNILGWAPSGRMDQGADVLENSIYLPPYNMTLTILTQTGS